MADFKIKPAAGTGNKLILESEDGTDVLTTSASGVTLASATLNSPTLVTPNLGTPASGTLTNATFPAGHVIKYVTGLNTSNSGSQSSDAGAVFGATITLASPLDGSKIITWALGGEIVLVGNGTPYKTRCGLDFTQSGASGSPNTYWSGSSSAHANYAGSYADAPGVAFAEYTSDGTNDIVIQCRCGRYDSYNGIWYANANTPVRIMAMEIQQ